MVGLVLLGVAAGTAGAGSIAGTEGTGSIAGMVLPAGTILGVQSTDANLTVPANGRLRVPDLTVVVTGVAWPAASATDPGVVAGPGHRLVVVVLSLVPPNLANNGIGEQPTVSLVVGLQSDTIGPFPIGYPASSDSGGSGTATFVASVPAHDHDVLLQVASDGVSQAFDLWTLQRVVAATGTGLLQAVKVTDTVTGRTSPTYVILASATPSAFDPGGAQPAPAGQAYLVFRFSSTVAFLGLGLPASCQFIAGIAPLPGSDVTVTPTGGTARPTQAEDPVPPGDQQWQAGDSGLLDAAYVVTVPTGLTTATVTVAPSTTTGTSYAGCNRSGSVDPLQVAGPTSFTVRFPAVPAAGTRRMPPWIGAPLPPTGTSPATAGNVPASGGGFPSWLVALAVLAMGGAVVVERVWRRRKASGDPELRPDVWVLPFPDAGNPPCPGGGTNVSDQPEGPDPWQASDGDRQAAAMPVQAAPAPPTAPGQFDPFVPPVSSAPHVVLTYQLTKREAVGSMHARILRMPRFYLAGLLGATCLLVGVTHGENAQFRDLSSLWMVLVAMGGMYLMAFVQVVMAPYRAWEANAEARGPQSLVVSEHGTHGRSVFSERRSSWAGYSATYELADAYLLRLATGRGYTVVPKRAFTSPGDEAMFRDLVGRHTTARLRPQGTYQDRVDQRQPMGRMEDEPV